MNLERSDRLAVILGSVLLVLAMAIGLHAGNRERDIDEVVFQRTLTFMNHGRGYYRAMRAALVEKEHLPPSQVRSIRPPTMFLVLYRLPAAALRWVVGAVFAAVLALAWRLGRGLSTYGGPVAVALTGLWLVAASPMLYLHPTLWALPFLLAGLLAMRNERWAAAALCLAGAAVIREPYALAFAAGFVWTKDRRWWWPTAVVLGGLGALHARLASEVLARHGLETPFGASGLSARYVLTAIGPGTQPLAWAVGLLGGALGLWALARRWTEDRAARTLLTYALAMYPATILFGRTYWGLGFAPAVAVYAPAAGAVVVTRVREFANRMALATRRPFHGASS